MSDSANLDLVRSIFADWERGDFSHAAWAHPEIEQKVVGAPGEASFTGLAEMGEGFRHFVSSWQGYSVAAQEFRELDSNRVLALIDDRGRGKASGLDLGRITGERAVVFHISGGKVRRLDVYWDRDRALSDLGLEG